MRFMLVAGFVAVAALLASWGARAQVSKLETTSPAAGKSDELTEKGLVKSGSGYVLAEEKELLEGIKALRETKKAADLETRQRAAAEKKIADNRKIKKDGIKEIEDIERRLPNVKDVTAHNRLVTRANLLIKKIKEAEANEKDLEESANKLGSEAKTKFVDEMAVWEPKFDEAVKKYNVLVRDGTVRSALEKINEGSTAKMVVGPSADFTAAVADLDRWRSEVNSEAVPMRDENGVYTVEVLVNGERLRMVVDTGASHITLPWETAEKLNITPGEKDRDVKMKLANGAIIDGKLITLKSVRVGRFTVNDVTCVVLQQGLSDPPTMLGSSFFSHFVVKINQNKGELHLTEVTTGGKKPGAP